MVILTTQNLSDYALNLIGVYTKLLLSRAWETSPQPDPFAVLGKPFIE
jgi:hypothetical protein